MIAAIYSEWLSSSPFDYDASCALAIKNTSSASEAIQKATKMNKNTLTNSGLARIMPLAAWTSNMETSEDVKKCIQSETELTHANTIV